jgi:hypothetical protein
VHLRSSPVWTLRLSPFLCASRRAGRRNRRCRSAKGLHDAVIRHHERARGSVRSERTAKPPVAKANAKSATPTASSATPTASSATFDAASSATPTASSATFDAASSATFDAASPTATPVVAMPTASRAMATASSATFGAAVPTATSRRRDGDQRNGDARDRQSGRAIRRQAGREKIIDRRLSAFAFSSGLATRGSRKSPGVLPALPRLRSHAPEENCHDNHQSNDTARPRP